MQGHAFVPYIFANPSYVSMTPCTVIITAQTRYPESGPSQKFSLFGTLQSDQYHGRFMSAKPIVSRLVGFVRGEGLP